MYMPQERRAYILRLLEQRGHIRSANLARELGVTDETIRTDIIALEQEQLLERIHGGARSCIQPSASEQDTRFATQIATIARSFITEGDCFFLEECLYSRCLIKLLRNLPCSIVSNSPSLIKELLPTAQKQQIIALGGLLDQATGQILGSECIRQVQQIKLNHAFLSPHSLSATSMGYNSMAETQLADTLQKQATTCYLLVPSQSLSTVAAFNTSLLRCAAIITEDTPLITSLNIPVHCVPHVVPYHADATQ